MENDFDWNDVESMTVTLSLEDGTECDCEVITVFDYEGKSYIAVVATEELENASDDDEAGVEAMIYGLGGANWEEMELENIPDDKYDEIAERFNEIMLEEDDDE